MHRTARQDRNLLHQIFTHCKHTLVGAVLFGEAFFRRRTALVDIHNIHGSVADVKEHIDSLEFSQAVSNSREALRENVCTDKINVIVSTLEIEIGAFVLKQICLKTVLLLGYPGQGQSRRKVNTGRGQPADIQFSGNGGKNDNFGKLSVWQLIS